MNKLAYLALGILVEQYHQYLTQSSASAYQPLSSIWKQMEMLYQPASFEEIQAALNALVDADLIEKEDERPFLYRFCVQRKATKQSA